MNICVCKYICARVYALGMNIVQDEALCELL